MNTSKHSFNILGDLLVEIEVTGNPFGLPLDVLFEMAARINKKRSFLFVSKILGKHIPVHPHVSLLGGAALALLLQNRLQGSPVIGLDDMIQAFVEPDTAKDKYEALRTNPLEVEEPLLFIAFAETATALGHSMYSFFKGQTRFLHTTREIVAGMTPVLEFEEEHSHATAHRCYARQATFFNGTERVVLVDDEITTGNTSLNIIRDLHSKHPRSHYVIASLLDWRSASDKARFANLEKELGITIECLSLLQGEIRVSGGPIELERPQLDVWPGHQDMPVRRHYIGRYFEPARAQTMIAERSVHEESYMRDTGRFGMDALHQQELEEQLARAGQYIRSLRTGNRTLCMGTGEFMYIPMRLASEMGEGVSYQSSTRSPIYPHRQQGYGIQNVFSFDSMDCRGTLNFFYNVPLDTYDELFVFIERAAGDEQEASFLDACRLTGIPVIHIVYGDQ
ncbi:phosphoribosyltransferase family protein [Paenibacillus sp. ACRRX]|nr:phosphoribosyltransferase family protein [Paenibacillus sp. ACRRX]